jgi:hypothetical protein
MVKEQSAVCSAFSKQLKLAKYVLSDQVAEYLDDNGGESAIAEFSLPSCGSSVRFAVTKANIEVSQMFFENKLKKSELYSDLVHFTKTENVDFISFNSGKAVMVGYLAESYSGLGGVYVSGYVLEPIANYVAFKYPSPELD